MFHINTKATFDCVDPIIAEKLLQFSASASVGDEVTIDEITYVLNFLSIRKRRDKIKSLSVYYEVNDSILRISDHWSSSDSYNSERFNCGNIVDCFWKITNCKNMIFKETIYSTNKKILAGICALSDFVNR